MSKCNGECKKDRTAQCAHGAGCMPEKTADLIEGVRFVSVFGRVREKCQELDQMFINAGNPAVFEKQFRKALCLCGKTARI